MSAATITIDQGAALLWLRQVGGRAGCDRQGRIAVGCSCCPLVFANFEVLDHAGLVKMRLPGDIAECRLEVSITEAGATTPIEPESERRLDRLMRRFDD